MIKVLNMKVCYIFREKERNAHSIEILFDKISSEIQDRDVEIEKWYKPLSNLKAILSVRKLKADVYHITGDCYFLALFLPWNKTLMTIHDIGMYKDHPKTFKKKLFVLASFILPLKLLKTSTAISNLTKGDLVTILNVNPDKVEVIPNPLVFPLEYSPKPFNELKPVILQIGTGNHKNLLGLIEAVKGINCKIEIVGKPTPELIEKMVAYGIDYSISTNISNEQVIEKYHNCDILFFASHSEGFGLPILEAQAIGRPVITSNAEPMISVCGKGGVLVDAKNPESIKSGILSLINDKPLRDQCILDGLSNVKGYDIKDIANRYLSIYQTLK